MARYASRWIRDPGRFSGFSEFSETGVTCVYVRLDYLLFRPDSAGCYHTRLCPVPENLRACRMHVTFCRRLYLNKSYLENLRFSNAQFHWNESEVLHKNTYKDHFIIVEPYFFQINMFLRTFGYFIQKFRKYSIMYAERIPKNNAHDVQYPC